jgi:hypothetical protein
MLLPSQGTTCRTRHRHTPGAPSLPESQGGPLAAMMTSFTGRVMTQEQHSLIISDICDKATHTVVL